MSFQEKALTGRECPEILRLGSGTVQCSIWVRHNCLKRLRAAKIKVCCMLMITIFIAFINSLLCLIHL